MLREYSGASATHGHALGILVFWGYLWDTGDALEEASAQHLGFVGSAMVSSCSLGPILAGSGLQFPLPASDTG